MPTRFDLVIDDDLNAAKHRAIEVVLTFQDGRRRWCFFFTPEGMRACGDWVPGTQVPFHVGAPHIHVVAVMTEDIIRAVLEHLDDEGRLERHTMPIKELEDDDERST